MQQQGNMLFSRLDDSPMFRQQIQCLEENAETLRERSLKFYKGCRKYTEGLGEGYDRDIAFASTLETFGGGHNDPICVSFGGPDMTKFAIALREIGTYKEVLRSQVENILNDRLLHFANIDLQDVKEARKRFDKANVNYDQVREKFLSLRKSTRIDIAVAVEERRSRNFTMRDLHLSKLASIWLVLFLLLRQKRGLSFWRQLVGHWMLIFVISNRDTSSCIRWSLISARSTLLLQVSTFAQQSRDNANYEQASLHERMQQYKRQVDQESRRTFNGSHGSPNGDVIHPFSRSSHKVIEAVMQSTAAGKG